MAFPVAEIENNKADNARNKFFISTPSEKKKKTSDSMNFHWRKMWVVRNLTGAGLAGLPDILASTTPPPKRKIGAHEANLTQ